MGEKVKATSFEHDLKYIINCHGLDNEVGLPDWVIAKFIIDGLSSLNGVMVVSEKLKEKA